MYQEKNTLVSIELARVGVFIPALSGHAPEINSMAWDSTCGFLVRFVAGWLKGQTDGWRRHILDKVDHAHCLLETIPLAEWPNLEAPGIVGRLARIGYETTREMAHETFLRIVAKFPRGKRHSESTLAQVARKIVADPVLRERLTPRRVKH